MGDPCGLSGFVRQERYGDIEMFLTLMGTGSTRSLYVLTARGASSRRWMFDLRVEAALDELLARARRTRRSADDELADVAFSYGRHLVDSGAYQHTMRFRLQIGAATETLEPRAR